MYRMMKACLILAIPLINPALMFSDQEVQNTEPQVYTRFFSADAVQAIPKLHHLNDQDPGFNKVLFKIEGFPKNQELVFEIKRTVGQHAGQYRQLLVFKVQEDGTILTNDNRHLKSLVSSSRGFLPGERVTYRIHTPDGVIDKEVSGIPAPIVVKDQKNNVLARAELLSMSPTVYAIDLPTMKEGEEYELRSISLGEIITAKARFNSKKPFHYAPAARGKNKGGEAILEIRRKAGDSFAVKLPWGAALNGYLNGQKNYPIKH